MSIGIADHPQFPLLKLIGVRPEPGVSARAGPYRLAANLLWNLLSRTCSPEYLT
jgi:hypothetical protein